MAGDSLPVRLAVYLKMLGSQDDSYPAEWLDPATGELPTMQQLAALDQVSLPTLRKRRDAAIAGLLQGRLDTDGECESAWPFDSAPAAHLQLFGASFVVEALRG